MLVTKHIYGFCILTLLCYGTTLLMYILGPSLKVVGTISVGYDHVNLAAMKKYGIRLGYTPDVLTEAVAETTVGLLISTTRRFFEANHALKT